MTEWRPHNGTKIYLCAALELATRAVIGYKVALHCAATLVTDVIDQVRNNFPTKVILFHSDQGSQFTSKEVVNKIDSLKWVQ
ncbi:DDE-type integrase/transposase/recombinase, partial [Enterococcus sp. AZ128]|uniref:DDE-type integrase/transposase/recombinase n=1 Tax=Enterococcus sp. AZ128 TaxID=2774630 RepID=UPI003F68609C